MKSAKYLIFISFVFILFGCQQNGAKKQNQTEPPSVSTEIKKDDDARPKDQRYFLDKVEAESDYDITSNSIKKDFHIESFNKYAKDTLKEFKDWEFVVTEINDYSTSASTIGKLLGFDSGPIYNLVLVAPIKIDRSVDTIAISNRVDFTYTLPKKPKNAGLLKQLSVIKTLSKGDVVLVSGALTHLDDKGKINFASFYDQMGPWNVDLMVNAIRKSENK